MTDDMVLLAAHTVGCVGQGDVPTRAEEIRSISRRRTSQSTVSSKDITFRIRKEYRLQNDYDNIGVTTDDKRAAA